MFPMCTMPSFVISSPGHLVNFDSTLMLLTGSLVWICGAPWNQSTLPSVWELPSHLQIKTCSSFIQKSEKGSNRIVRYKICLKCYRCQKFPCQTCGNIRRYVTYSVLSTTVRLTLCTLCNLVHFLSIRDRLCK